MNEINLAARVRQGLLAIAIVVAIGLAFQLTIIYAGGGIYAL